MWIPKCCSTKAIIDPTNSMRNNVGLYLQQLKSSTVDGIQKNTYSPNFIINKKCHINDKSLTAQDTAITNGIRDTSLVKEFIFTYFDTTGLQFNEIIWSGTRFKILTPPTKQSAVRMDGKLYIASDTAPFISILAGIVK